MTLFRLAGFTSVRITSQWHRVETAPPATELAILTQRRRRGAALRRTGLRLRLSAGLERRRRSRPRPQRQFAEYLARSTQPCRRRQRHRRQRAEPEPLLAAAVQPRRHRRGRACLPRRCWRRRTTRSRRSTRRARLGRRARATRRRQAGHRSRHALADRVHPRPGRRVPGQRPDAPIMDGFAFHPYGGQLRQSPDTPHPNSTTIGLADYESSSRASAGVRRDRAGRVDAADPLRRVRRRVATSRREDEGLHRHRAGDDQAGRRDDAGRPTTSRRCSSPSASRTSSASSSSTPRTSRRSPAGSPASTTPTGRRSRASRGARRARAHPRRLDRPLRRARPRRDPDDAPLPSRPSSRAARATVEATLRRSTASGGARLELRTDGTRLRLTGYGGPARRSSHR